MRDWIWPVAVSRGRLLVVNAGSSSLKLRLLDGADELVDEHDLPAVGGGSPRTRARRARSQRWATSTPSGHRVVHGGTRFRDAVVRRRGRRGGARGADRPRAAAPAEVARGARRRARGAAGRAARGLLRHRVPRRRCRAAAATYALPAEWRERWALRRYGFHGLSHAYASRRAAELLGRAAATRCAS